MGHPIQPNVKFVPHLPRKKFEGRRRSDWSEAKTKWILSIGRPAIWSKEYHARRTERLSKRYDEMHPQDKGRKQHKRYVNRGRAVPHSRARATTKRRSGGYGSAVSRRRKTNKPRRSRYSQLM